MWHFPGKCDNFMENVPIPRNYDNFPVSCEIWQFPRKYDNLKQFWTEKSSI